MFDVLEPDSCERSFREYDRLDLRTIFDFPWYRFPEEYYLRFMLTAIFSQEANREKRNIQCHTSTPRSSNMFRIQEP